MMEAEQKNKLGLKPEINEHGSHSSFEKKEKILDAAEKLYGEMGFEAVSTRKLAKEAGVNMAMLSYYFGSKDKLFESMIHRRTEEGRARMISLVESDANPEVKIALIIDQYVDKIFDSGMIHAIFSREISLSQRSTVSDFICESYMGHMKQVARVLTEGEEKGVFNKVDKEMTIIMIMTTIRQLINAQAMTRKIFDIPDTEMINSRDDIRLRIKDHLKSVILTYLTAKPFDIKLVDHKPINQKPIDHKAINQKPIIRKD